MMADEGFIIEEHSGDAGSEDASGALALDEHQAKEIRQIFLNTLPEYLEPVSQMLAQILAATDGQPNVRRALDTTLSSIAAAASRVGITDVCAAVDEMRDRLLALDEEPWPPSPAAQEGLRRSLAALEELAGTSSRTVAGGAAPETIVAALQHAEGIDPGVLERLTAAGLVTMDQLRGAHAHEVVAVSGLDAARVERLLAIARDRSPKSKGAEIPGSSGQAEPSLPLTGAAAHTSEGASCRSFHLEERIGEQVDAEASLDALRAQILRARLHLGSCRELLATAESRRARLQQELGRVRTELAFALSAVTDACRRRSRLTEALADRDRCADALGRRLATLRREREVCTSQRDEFASTLTSLAQKLAHLKDALETRREADTGTLTPGR
jgi:hypothetical protein